MLVVDKIHLECEIHNTQYSTELSVHKQPSAFNTTYTIQCRVNCPIELGIHVWYSKTPLNAGYTFQKIPALNETALNKAT